jgi:hypothetical protein
VFFFGSIGSRSFEQLTQSDARAIVESDQSAVVTPSLPQTPTPDQTSLYTVYVNGATLQQVDFAKQILTMLGTLVTSVVSFYFGAQVVSSAKQGEEKTTATPNGKPDPDEENPPKTPESIAEPRPNTLSVSAIPGHRIRVIAGLAPGISATECEIAIADKAALVQTLAVSVSPAEWTSKANEEEAPEEYQITCRFREVGGASPGEWQPGAFRASAESGPSGENLYEVFGTGATPSLVAKLLLSTVSGAA